MDDIPGFSLPGSSNNNDVGGSFKLQKKTKKGGGFQAMGLSFHLLKGITKRGYKIPTPIQRKTIPLILEGRDVVAMAKTGSGKTACFLIPMFEKLKRREPTTGARALILSPTRELAIQTYKFIKDLGKFMDLKIALVLGGDSMDSQFSALHTCPDVIVATPGRFLHLCVEMNLKLNSIQYAVFDEADRLFEMGFGEQLNDTLNRLPQSKQMVMFSATLPKLLVDFAKAGLSDPVLIRLDVESKLPEGLTLKYVHCRPDERYTALCALLKYVIPENEQTVVFAGTQHHVELISFILTEAGISNTLIYSSMDPSARKINTAKFSFKKVSVLIVTDVAARGIDIPSLDYVINVHFPGKPKLFVHRVGRCARAGRNGTAYSIFSTDDEAHLIDLHLFLNRPFHVKDTSIIGVIPQDILEEEHQIVMAMLKNQHISGVYRTSVNAYKKYISTRPAASADSNKRVKHIKFTAIQPLDDFAADYNENKNIKKSDRKNVAPVDTRLDLISQMQKYRPQGTVFELNPIKKSIQFEIMKDKRRVHSTIINNFKIKMDELEKEQTRNDSDHETDLPEPTENDIQSAFEKVVMPKKRKNTDDLYKKKSKKPKRKRVVAKDEEHYIPYQSADKHTEEGLAINSFEREARKAEFNITDAGTGPTFKAGTKKWDRIKKKMVAVEDPRANKIRTESGIWIPATYKTGRYAEWKEKTKFEDKVYREEGLDIDPAKVHAQKYPVSRWARNKQNLEAKKRSGVDSELKNPDQIVKQRIRLENIKKRELQNKIKKQQNRKKTIRKQRQKNKGKSGKA